MIRSTVIPVVALALVTAAPALAAPQKSAREDCESRMAKLDKSTAEGQQRLDEKNEVIEFCDKQYKRDKTIGNLVQECAKYEEQPVVKQQAVAECQLAAYNYANNLRSLKADFGR